MEKKVQKIIQKIRPSIQMDGGDIKLVDVDEKKGVVKIKFQGACAGCALASVTLHAVVAQAIKSKIPQIKDVVAVDFE